MKYQHQIRIVPGMSSSTQHYLLPIDSTLSKRHEIALSRPSPQRTWQAAVPWHVAHVAARVHMSTTYHEVPVTQAARPESCLISRASLRTRGGEGGGGDIRVTLMCCFFSLLCFGDGSLHDDVMSPTCFFMFLRI